MSVFHNHDEINFKSFLGSTNSLITPNFLEAISDNIALNRRTVPRTHNEL